MGEPQTIQVQRGWLLWDLGVLAAPSSPFCNGIVTTSLFPVCRSQITDSITVPL